MANLLLILVVLFAALLVTVKLVERFGKPMEPAQQQKLSRVAMVLITLLIVGSLVQQWVVG